MKRTLLTTRDVQRIADVSPMTVYNWRKHGVIAHDAINHKVRLEAHIDHAGMRPRVFFKPEVVARFLAASGHVPTLKEARAKVAASCDR